MNIEEYRRRIDSMHTVTGIPSYWEELQDMTAERDSLRKIADDLYKALLQMQKRRGIDLDDADLVVGALEAYEQAVQDE